MSSRPWRQVISINRWRQDVLSIKKNMSRYPASRCRIRFIWGV